MVAQSLLFRVNYYQGGKVATPKDHPLNNGRYGQFDRNAAPLATDLYWSRAAQILSKASKMEERDAREWFLAKAEYYIGSILESELGQL